MFCCRSISRFFVFSMMTISLLGAETKSTKSSSYVPYETSGKGQIALHNTLCSYTVHTSVLPVDSSSEGLTAHLFYTAYFAENSSQHPRPIAFCFNGGPGAASLWLHMGLLGPKTIALPSIAHPSQYVPYKDNPDSLLSICDLVFIDPTSTGFSWATPEHDAYKLYNVEKDSESIAQFIENFLIKYNRWESPKFLIGESYGAFRAIITAKKLHELHAIDLHGLMLISSVFDFHLFDTGHFGNDIAQSCTFPSHVIAAHYHKKLPPPFSSMNVEEISQEAIQFTQQEYLPALALGTSITQEHKERIAQRMSMLTSIQKDFFLRHNLRLTSEQFGEALLNDPDREISQYESQTDIPSLLPAIKAQNQLSLTIHSIQDSFKTAFNTYLHKELHLQPTKPYIALNCPVGLSWSWSLNNLRTGLGYVSALPDLHLALQHNSSLKIFAAAGYYDLVTTAYAQEYALQHAALTPHMLSRVEFKKYHGGHMMYLHPACKRQLSEDLAAFIAQAIAQV